MGLLDDLTAAASSLDPTEQPSSNDVAPLLGALIHWTEHGQAFLDAAAEGPQAVSDLLAGSADTPEPSPPRPDGPDKPDKPDDKPEQLPGKK